MALYASDESRPRRASGAVGRARSLVASARGRIQEDLDAAIAREVVTLKAELERIREQSQNLE